MILLQLTYIFKDNFLDFRIIYEMKKIIYKLDTFLNPFQNFKFIIFFYEMSQPIYEHSLKLKLIIKRIPSKELNIFIYLVEYLYL